MLSCLSQSYIQIVGIIVGACGQLAVVASFALRARGSAWDGVGLTWLLSGAALLLLLPLLLLLLLLLQACCCLECW
jgi:hypothetical protein